jgi:hypothetical protein
MTIGIRLSVQLFTQQSIATAVGQSLFCHGCWSSSSGVCPFFAEFLFHSW